MEETNDPLIDAIHNSKLEDLVKTLRQDVDQNRLGLALLEAVDLNNEEALRILLSVKAPLGLVNIQHYVGGEKTTTALHVASRLGHLASVETLINMGSNPNLRDSDNITALHEASYNGHIPVIAKFLDSGMDIESPGFEGRKPLLYAVCGRRIDTVRFLIDRGANVNACDSNGVSCLMCACNTHGKTPDAAIIRLLIEKGADMEARTLDCCPNKGFTPLMLAVIHPDAETNASAVAELIAAGANLEAKEHEYQSTALHLSIANSTLGACKLLLEAGANAQAVNHSGGTIWHFLGWNFNMDNLKEWAGLLLTTGVSINAKKNDGYTPLSKIIDRVTFDPSNELDRRAPGALEIFLKAGADAAALANDKSGLLHQLISEFFSKCCSTSAQLSDANWGTKCRSAAQFIRRLATAGARGTEDINGFSPMRRVKDLIGEAAFNQNKNRLAPVLVALVAAGDHHCFDLLPCNAPLPGLGAALIDVWRNDRGKLPYLFARLGSEDQETVRLLLKCLRFGSLGRSRSRTKSTSSIPEELRIHIISYALAAA